ncbi:pilus assembly PilX family protein [Usitatibacter palustris]|uniref:Tfp pilus assembly protein PilX n=1 Tax=Usitatibacter palustris TaxID=2732487 RepID=A0A6M4HA38_9PROT|nr:hypothetical protein [Usitatibacter palustris]QJR16416.1 hypothetical protein DSM104440_03250 [Usitatibacter palustris]
MSHPKFARRQKGVVLLISLIVLVAMTMAGVALMRSVDTATVVAGNVAFKEAAVQVADRGTQEAVRWLVANSAGATLQATNETSGYFSNRPVVEPDWFEESAWTDAISVAGGVPDASGNRVRYLIHRMCTQPDTAYNAENAGVSNECAMYFAPTTSGTGGSMSVGAPQFVGKPQLYYRVTTRVDGPRNTVSVIQTSVLVQV